MSSHSAVQESLRPYSGQHRKPELAPAPATPPPWADGDGTRQLAWPVGEGPTRRIQYPAWQPAGSLPARAKGAALQAETEPVHRPKSVLLGRCLHALRVWGRR